VNRKISKALRITGLVLVAGAPCHARTNVLFIVVDDLRPALGCYGDKSAITPNIDRLAKRGIVFGRAYCQQAVCSPSRLSMLTGLRPDTIRVWDLGTHFREAVPEAVTMPQHFKNHGYHTRSIGKIFHGGGKPAKDPPSWSEDPLFDTTRDLKGRYARPENLAGTGLKRAASESAEVPDETYVDGQVCVAALAALTKLKESEKPFFLAVGFRKPHLPFCAPKKYWDLYQRDEIPAPVTSHHPGGAPELGVRSWGELEGYTDIPNEGKPGAAKVQELRHGYYACVSYIDALVGRLLDRLARLNLAEHTVVCLLGDHGFHLGEQGLWTKANNYELSTRVPLVVAVPGQKHAGRTTDALVELVDLYPTLAGVCGLKEPEGVEGLSFEAVLREPDRPWKTAVISQFPRMRNGNRHRGHGEIMGYAMRTARYRYVEWREWKTGKVEARELYDHQGDAHEMLNLAGDETHAPTLKKLAGELSRSWNHEIPPYNRWREAP